MSHPSRWWTIPGALLVLAGVLTLGDRTSGRSPGRERAVIGTPVAMAAAELPGEVFVRDASGQRRLLALDALAGEVLIVSLPKRCAGKRVHLTLWRRIDGVRESQAWIDIRPPVRSDATVPMAGIVAGRYDVRVEIEGEPPQFRLDVASPGRVDFAAAPSPR